MDSFDAMSSTSEMYSPDYGGVVDLVRFDSTRAPRARLLCLPCAGGGPLEYRTWGGDALPGVEVLGVRLPGRETRVRQPPFRRLAPLLTAILAALRPLPPLPLALFGHSMGALIAFELARKMRSLGWPTPIGLLLASRIAPQLQTRRSRLFELSEDAFLARLHAYGGSPARVLADPGLMTLMMPILRADFEVVETYDHVAEAPLDCSIAAIGGLSDPFTSASEIDGWAQQTSRGFSLHLLPGGHFFQRTQRDPLLALVRRQLNISPGM